MKELKILQKIGLSENEASIYLCLIKNGYLSISQVSELTKIHRPWIYKTLPHLIDLGLISEVIQWKRRLYAGESPDNLENIFEKTRSDFTNALFSLRNEYKKEKQKPILKSIEGENFNKFIFEDVVNTLDFWETYMRYSARTTDQWTEKYDIYRKIRDTKEIQRLIITSEDNAKKKPKRLNHEVLTIPSNYDLFDDNISKVIYKDKVAIIDYNTKTSFIIEDEKFAKFEAKIFKLLFKFLRGKKS